MTKPRRFPRPQTYNAHELSRTSGLGCSLFARRYWGNRVCFLFLGVLRWFTSPRSLLIPYLIQGWMTGVCPAGFPHSEILGSEPVCGLPRLIAAYRVLHRLLEPSHPPKALCSLTTKNVVIYPAHQILVCGFTRLFQYILSKTLSRLVVPKTPERCRYKNFKDGGDDRIRTDDLMLAKHALSQLSYIPMVGPIGIEPMTSALSARRSSQLSYGPHKKLR